MTAITISSTVFPNWQGGASPILRIYADKNFLTTDKKRIYKQKVGGSDWYQSITGSVGGTNLTIGSFVLDSTVDSDTPDASYTGVLFDSAGLNQLETLFSRWQVPASLGASIAFADLVTYNNNRQAPATAAQIANLVLTFYTQTQITALLAGYYTKTQSDAQYMPIGKILASQLTADFPITNNAVAADTPLSVTVAPGNYQFECILHLTEGGAGGLRWNFNGTATIANFIEQYILHDTADTVIQAARNTLFTGQPNHGAGMTTAYLKMFGSAEVSVGGTWTFQAAQKTSDPGAMTILRGSTLRLIKTS